MQFVLDENVARIEGRLLYRIDEHSFDFEVNDQSKAMLIQQGNRSTTSILIGSLQLEVSVETGMLLYGWGYFPRYTWKTYHLPKRNPRIHGIRIMYPDPLQPGMSVPLVEVNQWPTFHDPKTGLVCVGSIDNHPDDQYIEFARNIMVNINRGELQAIWLLPELIG